MFLITTETWQQWLTGILIAIACILLGVFSFSIPAIAQSDNPIPVQTSPPEPPITPDQTQASPELENSQELAAFFDAFVPQKMEAEHVLGGVISVVKDGQLFLTKAYGFADPEHTLPIDSDRTLFRVASLSKLFTDTAIMQLYEQGLLDLDTDINQYLQAFKIDNSYSQPVTISHLLTQTDGTTQRLLGIVAPTAEKMTPLEQFIPAKMPPFIFPPGQIYSYSNMGITLAGYLIQHLTQIPFVDYIDQNILQPLGMRRSSFQQPLPPELATDLTSGYRYQNQTFNSYPFLYFNIAPAAALSTTATDMANFMIAHLQQGRYKNRQILEPETVQLMHQQHFTHHPKLPGSAYGFHERLENNLRTIGHAGNMPGYSSSLTLLPEQNIGIFTAFNGHNFSIPREIISRFLDRYFPTPQVTLPQITANKINPQRFTGTYQDLEHPRDTIAKLTAPFGHLHVKTDANNQLTIETPGLYFPSSVTKQRLVPVNSLLYKQVNDGGYTAFAENQQGEITYLFNPVNAKIGAFEKIAWYETIVFQLWVAGICALLLLSACFIHPIRRWFLRSQKSTAPQQVTRYAYLTAAFTGALYLLPLMASGLYLWIIGAWKLAYGVPLVVNLLLHLLPIAMILAVGMLIWSIFLWIKHYWSWRSRLYYSLVTLAALIFIPLLNYWNFLSLQP